MRRGQMAGSPLTTSREDLLKAIRNIVPGSRTRSRQFDERTWPRLTEVEAVRIARDTDRSVLAQAAQRACEDDSTLCQAWS